MVAVDALEAPRVGSVPRVPANSATWPVTNSSCATSQTPSASLQSPSSMASATSSSSAPACVIAFHDLLVRRTNSILLFLFDIVPTSDLHSSCICAFALFWLHCWTPKAVPARCQATSKTPMGCSVSTIFRPRTHHFNAGSSSATEPCITNKTPLKRPLHEPVGDPCPRRVRSLWRGARARAASMEINTSTCHRKFTLPNSSPPLAAAASVSKVTSTSPLQCSPTLPSTRPSLTGVWCGVRSFSFAMRLAAILNTTLPVGEISGKCAICGTSTPCPPPGTLGRSAETPLWTVFILASLSASRDFKMLVVQGPECDA